MKRLTLRLARRLALPVSFLLTLLAGSVAAKADDPPVTNPITYTWIASSCETWNCAVSALVLAGGDKYVVALPTGNEERPWLILRRVEEGSVYVPEDEPYACEVFDSVDAASSRMTAMDTCHAPLILNVPDGRAVVTSLSNCTKSSKRRVAR